MCDYSLEMYKTRDARAGDNLTLGRFPSGSAGFTDKGSVGFGGVCKGDSCAVCIKPGTELLLTVPAGHPRAGVHAVVFTVGMYGNYRDGVTFADGSWNSLQQLPLGTTTAVVEKLAEVEDVVAPNAVVAA